MHYKEAAGILSAQNGMNVYRGCTHGCIYCDSWSGCYRMDHDFTDIEVKVNAPEHLEEALRRRRRKGMIGTGAMSDPYNPLEEDLLLTRRTLEIILRYGFGASILTKSDLVLRDLDLLEQIRQRSRCVVAVTLTTMDEELCGVLEPGVSTTAARVRVLEELCARNIPSVVWLCPILPFMNDTEKNLQGILDACVRTKVRGIVCFGFGMTLRERGVGSIFTRVWIGIFRGCGSGTGGCLGMRICFRVRIMID